MKKNEPPNFEKRKFPIDYLDVPSFLAYDKGEAPIKLPESIDERLDSFDEEISLSQFKGQKQQNEG